MNEVGDEVRYYSDRLLTARYNFWSGSLTAQAVFASVATALVSAAPGHDDWRLQLLGALALGAMVLLLLNFAMVKGVYELIGKRIGGAEGDLSEPECARDLARSELRHRLIRYFEIAATAALLAEIALLLWVLLAR